MPVDWSLHDGVRLDGLGSGRIEAADADRQRQTAAAVLGDLATRPGVVLADEVGMGKTYVALAVAASVLAATRGTGRPVVIMVPSRLRRKWQREWEQFRQHCTTPGAFDWVRSDYAHTPTEFFRLLHATGSPCHLVFMTTGCFSLGLQDPWIKLAFIRLARRHTKLSRQQKIRVHRWAPDLVRLATARNLTDEVVQRLLQQSLRDWKATLVEHGVLAEEAPDPVPEMLTRYESMTRHPFDWGPLCHFLRTALPARTSANIRQRRNAARQEFTDICRAVYERWLADVAWKAPLLILDEAHHAKNDTTRLARLFREPGENDIALLGGKFRRMLFLTATPFELGHHELVRVLQTFRAVVWGGSQSPSGTREEFDADVTRLANALDANRLAGRHLDQLWGKLSRDAMGGLDAEAWWERVAAAPGDGGERRLVEAVGHCRATRNAAESLLRPWVIRHNRSPEFPAAASGPATPRREALPGRAILDQRADGGEEGLPIAESALLPFLLAARAQGELANQAGARAFFAEGLSSSYEAFHHTREARGDAREVGDDGGPPVAAVPDEGGRVTVPTAWYERQVSALIPSRQAAPRDRVRHPKVSATVRRAVDLWEDGEKVLIFCVYRETARALYEHLREEVETRVIQRAGQKFGLDPSRDRTTIEARLGRIARRLAGASDPFNREVRDILNAPFGDERFAALRDVQPQLVGVLAAYFRSPSFIARHLPLEDPALRDALERGRRDDAAVARGREALRAAIRETRDGSNQTILQRVEQFLGFAAELAERARCPVELAAGEGDDEAVDPLQELLGAVAVHSRPRSREHLDRDDVEEQEGDGTYRVVPLVRMVYGDTDHETRDRLALAFNSPLFPEILVSSAVMGEGIDLHRFCRHVIHHDGFWNPSTLEQQTGRLDRIRSRSEVCRLPIRIYQPFLAGGADEKMYRVLRDRERWFQVVMGQKFEFDEATSEAVAVRVPLPAGLAAELTFDLARWRAGTPDPG